MPDGRIKFLHVMARATRDSEGRLEYIGAVQDVTQRTLSDEALTKSRSELAHITRVMSLDPCVSAFNLSLVMRKLLGAGTPRELKNRAAQFVLRLLRLLNVRNRQNIEEQRPAAQSPVPTDRNRSTRSTCPPLSNFATSTTGC